MLMIMTAVQQGRKRGRDLLTPLENGSRGLIPRPGRLAPGEPTLYLFQDPAMASCNIVTQLANDKNTASKQTAALVIAAYRDANPGAVVPDVLSETPSPRSLRAANALATALAQKKFPPR